MRQLILSHSKRQLWQQCHRKFQYSYVMGLKPQVTSKAMIMGTITHMAIEHWLKHPEHKDMLVQETKERDFLLGQALQTYFDKHEVDEDLDTFDTSVPFFEELHEDVMGYQVMLAGEIDALAKWRKNNSLWVVERKSTGQIPSNLVTRFNLDDQVRGYNWVTRRKWNMPVVGAIEDIIRFTKNTELVRDFVLVEDWMLDEWEADMIGVAEEIITAAEKNRYPMSPHACHNWGTCPYNDLCLNPDRISIATEMGYERLDPHDHELGIIRRAQSG